MLTVKQAEPHVPEDKMAEWREAMRKGDDETLSRLINELCEPVTKEKKPSGS